jgi:hypothetical protein
MEHGRRTSWTGRPRSLHVSAHCASRISRSITRTVSPTSSSASLIGYSGIPSSTQIGPAELNRQTREFRNAVTCTKQRAATCSNRQKIKFCETNYLQTGAVTCSAFSERFLTFLTGSALQTEFAVTHSKQRTGKFLTGARMHIRIFEILQMSAQNLAALNPQSHARFASFRAFLTETRIASLAHRNSSNIDSKLLEGRAWLRQ